MNFDRCFNLHVSNGTTGKGDRRILVPFTGVFNPSFLSIAHYRPHQIKFGDLNGLLRVVYKLIGDLPEAKVILFSKMLIFSYPQTHEMT